MLPMTAGPVGAFQFPAKHFPDQERVFAEAFEVPSVARLANDVGGPAQ